MLLYLMGWLLLVLLLHKLYLMVHGNNFLFPFTLWNDLIIFTFYYLLCLFYMFFENTYWLFRNGNELYLAKGRKKWSLH